QPRADDDGARTDSSKTLLDRDQPTPCAVRETRLHRQITKMLNLPRVGVLPAGRRSRTSVGEHRRSTNGWCPFLSVRVSACWSTLDRFQNNSKTDTDDLTDGNGTAVRKDGKGCFITTRE